MLNISKPAHFDLIKWKTETLDQLTNETSPISSKIEVGNKIESKTTQSVVIEEKPMESNENLNPKAESIVSEELKAKIEIQDNNEIKASKTKRKEPSVHKNQADSELNIDKINISSHASKTNNKKQKLKDEDKFNEEYVDSKDYAVWVPPSGNAFEYNF